MAETPPWAGPPRIFLSYVATDRAIATFLANGLRRYFDVQVEPGLIEPGRAWMGRLASALKRSDSVVILLSESTQEHARSSSDFTELADSAVQRDVNIVPVLLESAKVPISLDAWPPLDLSSVGALGFELLISRLIGQSAIDFGRIHPMAFENMVATLLSKEGFEFHREAPTSDYGIDLLGSKDGLTYIVQAKHYSRGRVSVSSIGQMAELVRYLDQPTARGILVTSAHLTSTARHLLRQERISNKVAVLDGPALKSLLLKHPSVVEDYFEPTQLGGFG